MDRPCAQYQAHRSAGRQCRPRSRCVRCLGFKTACLHIPPPQEYRKGKDMVILEGSTVSGSGAQHLLGLHKLHKLAACFGIEMRIWEQSARIGQPACRVRSCLPPVASLRPACCMARPYHRNARLTTLHRLQVDGIGNLVELNGRFAAELDAPVLMVRGGMQLGKGRAGRGGRAHGALVRCGAACVWGRAERNMGVVVMRPPAV